MAMEEGTLQLAQAMARQSLEADSAGAASDSSLSEAKDGDPAPLKKKTHVAKLEEKVQGFR